MLRQAEFSSRLLFTLLALLAIGGLIYFPIRRLIQQHRPVPLRANGQGSMVPTRVEMISLEKHWFVRLELDISRHGNAAEANIAAASQPGSAQVATRFAGKPFNRRPWRQPTTS